MKNKLKYYYYSDDSGLPFLYKYNLETKKIYFFCANGWKESVRFFKIDDLKDATKIIKEQEAALLS